MREIYANFFWRECIGKLRESHAQCVRLGIAVFGGGENIIHPDLHSFIIPLLHSHSENKRVAEEIFARLCFLILFSFLGHFTLDLSDLLI